jgi:cysteinyl-tRNA synthetase
LITDIYKAIADDLDTPLAIAKINEWVNGDYTDGSEVESTELINVIDALLGVSVEEVL